MSILAADEDSKQIRKLTTDLHRFLDELRNVTGSKKDFDPDQSASRFPGSRNAPGSLGIGAKSIPSIESSDSLPRGFGVLPRDGDLETQQYSSSVPGKNPPPPPPVPPRTSERAVIPQDIMEGPRSQVLDPWISLDNGSRATDVPRKNSERERAVPPEAPRDKHAGFNPEDIQNSLSKMREAMRASQEIRGAVFGQRTDSSQFPASENSKQDLITGKQKNFLSDVDALRQKHREWKATIANSPPESIHSRNNGPASTSTTRNIQERSQPPENLERRGSPANFPPSVAREEWGTGPPLGSSFGSGRGFDGGMTDTAQPANGRRGSPANFPPSAAREEWGTGRPLGSSFSSGRGFDGGMTDTAQPAIIRPDMRHAAVPMGLSHTFDSGFRRGPEFPWQARNGNAARERVDSPGGQTYYAPANGPVREPRGYDSAHPADDYRRGAVVVAEGAMWRSPGYGPATAYGPGPGFGSGPSFRPGFGPAPGYGAGPGSPSQGVQPGAIVHSPGVTPWQDASRPHPNYRGRPSPLRPPPGSGSPARPSSASGRHPPQYPSRPGSVASGVSPGGPSAAQRARQQLSSSMDTRGDASRRSAKANPNLVIPIGSISADVIETLRQEGYLEGEAL